MHVAMALMQGSRQGEILGLKPPFEFDMLPKLYHLREGDQMLAHTFCFLIFQLNANTTE